MFKIKVSTNFPTEPIARQTPGRQGIWKDCVFFINDPSINECDHWVVLDGLAAPDTARINSGNVILITMEPPAKKYATLFFNQFDLVVTSHRHIRHPNYRHDFLGLPWHVGLDRGPRGAHGEDGFRTAIDFDGFAAMPPPAKPKLMSTICSVASHFPGHRLRQEFVERMRREFGDRIDIFGRGVRPVGDKFEAMADYRFHVALENSSTADYCTEKLTDCYLSYCFPIYWGAPNISSYFPDNSYLNIDITRPDHAIAAIASLLASGMSEDRRQAMLQARRLVLDRYNTFDVMRRVCGSMPAKPRRTLTLRPERLYRGTLVRRTTRRLKAAINARWPSK